MSIVVAFWYLRLEARSGESARQTELAKPFAYEVYRYVLRTARDVRTIRVKGVMLNCYATLRSN
jgi:hypothetical protein